MTQRPAGLPARRVTVAFVTALVVTLTLAATALASPAPAERSRLVDAARARDAVRVETLLRGGADANGRQADGATALHWAAHWDDVALASALLAKGADANAANDLGVTPLQLACENGNAAMVNRLLDGGAKTAAPSHVPPLVVCARTGNVAAVSALLARKADVNVREPLRDQTPLMAAVANGHAAVVTALLAAGADVRARAKVTRAVINRANPNDIYTAVVGVVSRGGSTPLLFAARQGSPEVAALLLAAGADPNEITPDGTSVLTLAVHSGHAALARLLLDRGANPNIIGSGYTALHAAVLRGLPDVAADLVARGANVNARLRNGTATTRGSHEFFLPDSLVGATPLLLAAKFAEPAMMRALLARGADARLPTRDGLTVLMAAAGVGSETNLFDRRDRLAVLREADESRAREAVEIALGLPVDVRAADAVGRTALHGAAKMNHPSVVRLLVEKGARLDARTAKGETPLAMASGDEARQALREAGAKE